MFSLSDSDVLQALTVALAMISIQATTRLDLDYTPGIIGMTGWFACIDASEIIEVNQECFSN